MPPTFRRLLAFPAIALLLAIGGCAAFGYDRPPPPTIAQIVEMSRDKVPADDIVRRMRDSRATYSLSAAELARLHDEGVDDTVLNYMQNSYLDEIRRTQYPGYIPGVYGGFWGGSRGSGIGVGIGF